MNSRIEAHYFTNNGGVRPNNEDSLLIQDILINTISMEKPGSLETTFQDICFCVADGIGGEKKGEVASGIVLSAVRDYQALITSENQVSDALYQAKEQLEKYVLENPDAINLGSTIAGICIRGEGVIAFNAGDCRVYRINGRYFEQITRDHSVVQALYDEGIITEDEMQHHPRRNVVTSSVSGDGIPDSIQVFTNEARLRDNDVFFICSDGIWGCFTHDELEMIYQKFQGYEYCEKLLIAAIARRASDNISAILVSMFPIE